MMRTALAAILIIAVVTHAAAADEFYREDLRIPMAAAGPRGLEAMLIRPSGTRRYPLALLSHGAPRDAAARPGMTPNGLYVQAVELARRGFAALVVMRRGYGGSGGAYAENSGPCDRRNYLIAANASVADLRAAIDAMSHRVDITTQGMLAIGVSAGGFASVALSADPPPGLAAVISFAGGRGSRADNDVCDEDALVRAFAALGKKSRTPMLWVYAKNDKFFGPELAHRMHAAFTAAGGRARFIDAPAFGSDGHALFSSTGAAIWTPMVDDFCAR
jgi:dienelactone hydrolase